MDDKIKIIEKVYFDPAGFGSIAETLKDAKNMTKPLLTKMLKNGNRHKPLDRNQKLEA